MLDGLIANPHRRHLALTLLVAAGLTAYLAGAVTSVYGFDVALLLTLAGGFPLFYGAVSELLAGRLSADLAVAIAAVAALVIRQYAVAAEVVLIMLIGEALEHFAVGRTRSAIQALLALQPHTARVRRGDAEQVVPASEVRHDDIVLVRPGDRIPVDGRVLGGASSVDQSPITGESLPADKALGDEVYAGTINLYGALEVSVTRRGDDTTLAQIIHLVEEAEQAKAPTARLADRYATFFVPIVLLAAAAVWLLTRDAIRAVSVLVVACPCALVLATPTAVAAAIGRLVRRGVLAKGGAVLEALGRLRAVAFDKTGTLTLGRLRVAEVVPAPGRDAADVLRLAAAVERNSEHPIARLIVEHASQAGIAAVAAEGFAARPGLGASAVVDGMATLVGSPRFLEGEGVALPGDLQRRMADLGDAGRTVVLVASGGEAVGLVAVEDTLRPEAAATIERLRTMGIDRIALLTGDHPAAGRAVGRALGIEDTRAGLLPADKVQAVRALQREAAPVAMVGDGVNDAPSLAAADVGVAMAGIGTDVAVAAADLVLVGEDLSKLADAVACGRRALRIIWQNIIGFALAFNAAAVAAAAAGWIAPVAAAVLHQASSLVVCLNSLRLLVDFAAARARARQRLEQAGQRLWQRRARVAAVAAGALAALWLLSGLHVVRVGEVGVAQRFGRLVLPVEGPGLHYRLPFPLGRHRIVKVGEVRRVEIGFRTVPGAFAEPPAYEWNVQHSGGRRVRQGDEATLWAGDENLVEVNLVVHYRVADPLAALFAVGERLPDGGAKWDALVRAAAESALHAEMSHRTSDELLSTSRADIQRGVRERVAQLLESYGTGLEVACVSLGDVHPPIEVVPAFRDVIGALEEKESAINRAKAYRNRAEAIARGQAAERRLKAAAFELDRTLRAEGEATRFAAVAAAWRQAPELARLRLYIEMIEQVLAGRRKVILDRAAGRGRRLLFLGPKGLAAPLAGLATEATPPAAREAKPGRPPAPSPRNPAAKAQPPTRPDDGGPPR